MAVVHRKPHVRSLSTIWKDWDRKIDSLEYFLAMENLSLNFNSTYNTTNLSSNFLPICVENTTLNQSEEHQKLYQVPTVAVVVLSILYGAICILAILGNFLVLVLVIVSTYFFKKKSLQYFTVKLCTLSLKTMQNLTAQR